jgi:hypothetical protein
MRRWAGIGIAAAGGVVTVLTPTRCRVTGALGDDAFEIVASGVYTDLAVLFDNPRNPTATRAGSRCDFDWTVDGTAGLFLFSSLIDAANIGTKKASEWRPDYAFVDETRGDARAEAYKPRGQLIGGLALVGAGVVLALLPGGDQMQPTIDFGRRLVGVSRTVGW